MGKNTKYILGALLVGGAYWYWMKMKKDKAAAASKVPANATEAEAAANGMPYVNYRGQYVRPALHFGPKALPFS